MARASRRRAASPEPAEEPEAQEQQPQDDEMEVEEEEEAAHILEFDEPLTWRAGRPIQVSELLKRLKAFYEELSAMEQLEVEDQAGRDAVTPKAQELGSSQLLGHRGQGMDIDLHRADVPHSCTQRAVQSRSIARHLLARGVYRHSRPRKPDRIISTTVCGDFELAGELEEYCPDHRSSWF